MDGEHFPHHLSLHDTAAVGKPSRNDVLSLRAKGVPNDFDYTHGMGVSVEWADAPAWLRRRLSVRTGCGVESESEARRCVTSMLGVRQAIFAPPSNASRPVPGERPYAGYLAVLGGATLVRPGTMRSVSVELGTTGPLSMAEPIQRVVHNWTRAKPELGWDHQLAARPKVSARYDELRNRDRTTNATHSRSALRWTAEIGTLRTSATIAGALRLALNQGTLWLPGDGAQCQTSP